MSSSPSKRRATASAGVTKALPVVRLKLRGGYSLRGKHEAQQRGRSGVLAAAAAANGKAESVSRAAPPPPTPTASASISAAKLAAMVQAAADKKPNPRFKPLASIPPAATPTPVVPGRIPVGASILIIQEPWLGLILEGKKQLEIRGTICKKVEGERIYLALSGAGGVVLGSVEFTGCHGPLSAAEYTERASQHCVAGSTLPYGAKTYGWGVRAPERFDQPVRYPHRQGCVIWAKME